MSSGTRRRFGLAIACSFVACQGQPPAVDEIASYRGSSVTVSEIEARLRAQSPDPEQGAAAGWSDRYLQAAEEFVVERWLVRDLGSPTKEDFEPILRKELGEDFPRLRCEAAMEVLASDLPLEGVQPTEADVRAYYGEHPERFERPEQRLVWHLFLRDQDGETEVLTRLYELKARVEAGQAFRQLAREYSDSENRSLGGHLGWMVRGRLPPDLDDVVFALPAGGTSQPLSTDGGAFLVHVSDVLPGVSLSFDDARDLIAFRLSEMAVLERLEEPAADVELNDEALILEDESLLELLPSASPETEILRVGEVVWRSSHLREQLEKRQTRGLELRTPEDSLLETYRLLLARTRLCRQFLERAPEDMEAQQRFLAALTQRGQRELLERRLRREIWHEIDSEPEELRRFFRDNQQLFTSPLKLLVESLSLEIGADADASMRSLRELRSELIAGRLSLDEAASTPGAEHTAARWIGPRALAGMEPKIRAYLSQLEGTGYTVPFQLDGKLHLLHVVERQEPEPLPFDAVETQVRTEYVRRHEQRLFANVKEELLHQARFRFHPEVLERHLSSLGLGAAQDAPDR
ncbi:MAG: peptidyl-prolyl cis-trans isomerase [Thermoanaerobaculia bacterium]|nr:peptidyl-prolyl cis-trans isomerase [Thermoanaerobaculia bacterium]